MRIQRRVISRRKGCSMKAKTMKADLSNAAQNKLQKIVAETVEKKIKKEAKKTARKLTFRFIIAGAVLAVVCYAAGNMSKIIVLLKKVKK